MCPHQLSAPLSDSVSLMDLVLFLFQFVKAQQTQNKAPWKAKCMGRLEDLRSAFLQFLGDAHFYFCKQHMAENQCTDVPIPSRKLAARQPEQLGKIAAFNCCMIDSVNSQSTLEPPPERRHPAPPDGGDPVPLPQLPLESLHVGQMWEFLQESEETHATLAQLEICRRDSQGGKKASVGGKTAPDVSREVSIGVHECQQALSGYWQCVPFWKRHHDFHCSKWRSLRSTGARKASCL